MASIDNPYACKECGEIRLRTASGSVCPNGHGKIHPKMTASQANTATRYKWAETLPTATYHHNGLWEIEGEEGLYRRVKWAASILEKNQWHVPTGAKCWGYGILAARQGKKVFVSKFVKETRDGSKKLPPAGTSGDNPVAMETQVAAKENPESGQQPGSAGVR